MEFYPEILSDRQRGLLKKLAVLGKPYYMAGGTALALQIGHRTSLDFDFYSPGRFDLATLVEKLRGSFPGETLSEDQSEGTFQAIISGINISVFYYPYIMVGELVDYPPVQLASLVDIAAMKVVATVQRARQRDFFDLYFLVEKLGLEKVIDATYRKFPWYEENNQIIFRALTYFEEADRDDELGRVRILDASLTWEKVKRAILRWVGEYQRARS